VGTCTCFAHHQVLLHLVYVDDVVCTRICTVGAHKVASLQRCAVRVDSAVQYKARQRIQVDRLRRAPSRVPCHVSHRTSNCKARVKWPYFNWALRFCDRLPHPILAYCILVRHGVPTHVTRDHHSGIMAMAKRAGLSDRDHLGPARAANRQSSGVGCSFAFVHCAIVIAVGHQCQAP
jgi:hypothetical protein